jgi:hypothetical protein
MPKGKNNGDKEMAVTEAQKYVNEQLEILKRYGSAARISKSGYKSMVNQVVRVSAK